MTKYSHVPTACHCSVPALCAGAEYVEQCIQLEATQAALVEAVKHLLHRYKYDGSVTDAAVIQANAALKLARGE